MSFFIIMFNIVVIRAVSIKWIFRTRLDLHSKSRRSFRTPKDAHLATIVNSMTPLKLTDWNCISSLGELKRNHWINYVRYVGVHLSVYGTIFGIVGGDRSKIYFINTVLVVKNEVQGEWIFFTAL